MVNMNSDFVFCICIRFSSSLFCAFKNGLELFTGFHQKEIVFSFYFWSRFSWLLLLRWLSFMINVFVFRIFHMLNDNCFFLFLFRIFLSSFLIFYFLIFFFLFVLSLFCCRRFFYGADVDVVYWSTNTRTTAMMIKFKRKKK